MTTKESAEARSAANASGARAASTDGSDRLVRDSQSLPLWPCLCGARNRLRDTSLPQLRSTQAMSRREHLVVIAHNRLPWFVVRRLIRIVDFGDGTYMLGWRWRKKGWLVS